MSVNATLSFQNMQQNRPGSNFKFPVEILLWDLVEGKQQNVARKANPQQD